MNENTYENSFSLTIYQKFIYLSKIFFPNVLSDRKTLILILISIFPILTFGSIRNISEGTFIDLIEPGSIFNFILLPLISLILGISAIADEKENKTMSQLLARPVKREEILLSKWIVVLVIGCVIVCIDVTILYIGLAVQAQDFTMIFSHLEILIGVYLYICLWYSVYSTIFLVLGVIIDKNAIGYGLGIAYFEAFFSQFIFGLAIGGPSPFSISNHINYIAAEYFLQDYLIFRIANFDPVNSIIVCFGIILGALFIGMIIIRRKDFP